MLVSFSIPYRRTLQKQQIPHLQLKRPGTGQISPSNRCKFQLAASVKSWFRKILSVWVKRMSVHWLGKAWAILAIHRNTANLLGFFSVSSFFFFNQKAYSLCFSRRYPYSSPGGPGHLWSQVAPLRCGCDPGTVSAPAVQRVVRSRVLPRGGKVPQEAHCTRPQLLFSHVSVSNDTCFGHAMEPDKLRHLELIHSSQGISSGELALDPVRIYARTCLG